MTLQQVVERLQVLLAHAWMVRTFLKHAEELQEHPDMQEVHRVIFDYVRAPEPAYQRGDWAEYIHRLRSKLPKLRRAADYLSQEVHRISDHTNFQMAALSLSGCVREIEAILATVVPGQQRASES